MAKKKKTLLQGFNDNLKGKGKKPGGDGLKPLQELAQIIQGLSPAKGLTKGEQQKLAKIDFSKEQFAYSEKALAKFGLDKSLTEEQYMDFQRQYGQFADSKGRLNRKEANKLKKFGLNTAANNTLAQIQKDVDKLVPTAGQPGAPGIKVPTPVGDAGLVSPERGQLANLNMSIFARSAVKRARGVRGAISTTARGDSGYGASLARISIGGLA